MYTRSRKSKPASFLSLHNDGSESVAPRVVTPLSADIVRSSQSHRVTPPSSGRSSKVATPPPSSTVAAEADTALRETEPVAPRIVTQLSGDTGQSSQSHRVTPPSSGRSSKVATPPPSSTVAAEADTALRETEPVAPRIVTQLYGDTGQSSQSHCVTPPSSGRRSKVATPPPSSTVAAEADTALLETLVWKSDKKNPSPHPLAQYLVSRGTGQARGWFRLAMFGTVGGQGTKLSDQEKQYIGAQYMALMHLPSSLGALEHLELAWNIAKRTLRDHTRAFLQPLSTKSGSSSSLAAAVVEEEEVHTRNVDASELGSLMSTLLSNEQQMVGLRLGQNEHIEVPLSVLKCHFEAQLYCPNLEQLNEEILRKEPGDQLVDLVRRTLPTLQNGSGIVTLSYDSNGRADKKVYVHIPQSRGSELNYASHKKKAKTLAIILEMMAGTPRDQHSILMRLAKSLGLEVVEKDLRKTSAEEAVAFLSFVRLSAKDVCKVDRFFRSILGINLFPNQLLKILAIVEKKFTIAAAVFQMELKVSKKTHKSYVWWHLRDPLAILERLISSAFNENKFQKSSEFSSIKIQNVIYIAFGCDRGGKSTTMLVRVLNREGGNSAAYSQPICQYEDGAECYSNLAATVYSESYPIKKILQDLVDDAYHAITVKVLSSDKKIVNARTEIVKLDRTPWKDQQFLLTMYPGGFLVESEETPMPEWVERVERNVLHLAQLAEGEAVSLTIRIVSISNAEAELAGSTLVGFCLYEGEQELVRIPFCMPLDLAPSSSLSFEWHPLIGLPSQDTKKSLIVSGQGMASVKKPCLGCDMTKEDFEYPPTYFHEIDLESFPLGACKDGELRTGDKANAIAHANWSVDTADNRWKLSKENEMEF